MLKYKKCWHFYIYKYVNFLLMKRFYNLGASIFWHSNTVFLIPKYDTEALWIWTIIKHLWYCSGYLYTERGVWSVSPLFANRIFNKTLNTNEKYRPTAL